MLLHSRSITRRELVASVGWQWRESEVGSCLKVILETERRGKPVDFFQGWHGTGTVRKEKVHCRMVSALGQGSSGGGRCVCARLARCYCERRA